VPFFIILYLNKKHSPIRWACSSFERNKCVSTNFSGNIPLRKSFTKLTWKWGDDNKVGNRNNRYI